MHPFGQCWRIVDFSFVEDQNLASHNPLSHQGEIRGNLDGP